MFCHTYYLSYLHLFHNLSCKITLQITGRNNTKSITVFLKWDFVHSCWPQIFLSRREYPPQITPKMYLLEWCRKEKHPQPVYETVSQWKTLSNLSLCLVYEIKYFRTQGSGNSVSAFWCSSFRKQLQKW